MNEKLKEIIINDYELYYMEHEEEMKEKSFLEVISLYVSSLWYDLMDSIDNDREVFGINKDLSDTDAIMEIEDIITSLLIKYESEVD